MKTTLQKVTFYSSIIIVLIITVLYIYGSGRETTFDYENDINYYQWYTLYGDFHWSLIDWKVTIITIIVILFPIVPWLYWSMRKSGFTMNKLRTILLICCILHFIIVLLYARMIATSDTVMDYNDDAFSITQNIAYLIFCLVTVINYAFSVLFIIYKITRNILYRFHTKTTHSNNQAITK